MAREGVSTETLSGLPFGCDGQRRDRDAAAAGCGCVGAELEASGDRYLGSGPDLCRSEVDSPLLVRKASCLPRKGAVVPGGVGAR